MNAKSYLMQVKKLDKLIANKTIEKEQWQAMATSTGAAPDGERVKSSGSQQKMADAICKYIELEKELDRCIDALIDTKKDVIKTLEQLPAIEYDVLHKKYIQFIELEDVAEKYGKSYRWATRVHKRAIVKVQALLDERGENARNQG